MKSKTVTSPSGDWEARHDMETLIRAEEIRRDPKRLAAAQKCARDQIEAAATVSATQPTK